MSPAVLARRAAQLGLQLVALTDHNSALNAPAWQQCAAREGIVPLFGMEATTAEEVHVLCLFGEAPAALDFGAELRELLLPVPYNPDKLGDQVVVDADENVLDLPQQYFGTALTVGYDELCILARTRGALVIPAHIDRPMCGVLNQLGFLPPWDYDAVELMRPADKGKAAGYTITTGSDAHYPEHIGRRPFSIQLPENWQTPQGLVRLDLLAAALRTNDILLPGVP